MAFRGTQPFLDDTKGRPSRSFWSLWDFKTEPSASARTHEMKEPPREKGIGSGSYKVSPFFGSASCRHKRQPRCRQGRLLRLFRRFGGCGSYSGAARRFGLGFGRNGHGGFGLPVVGGYVRDFLRWIAHIRSEAEDGGLGSLRGFG